MTNGLFDFDSGYTDESSATFPDARPFQTVAINATREARREGHRAQMIMAPTGAGKTYIGLRLVQQALALGKRAVFVCDRTTLINQTSKQADAYGLIHHGIIQAQHGRRNDHSFQIASAQTLKLRGWPKADLIIIDEAHTQMTGWTNHIQTTKASVIGLSATPFSKGLGKLFTNLINAATMHQLTKDGVLVPMRVYSCTQTDMSGAKTAAGEWTDQAAEERGMAIVGDVVSDWAKYGDNRKTICFGATVAHCEELCNQFVKAGVMASLFTGHTKPPERESLLREFVKVDSQLKVLISVEALAKGFDVPDVSCVIDCRPMRKSLSTVMQMWGRGLRCSPATGKTDCLLLDHSGNITRFANDYTEIFFNGCSALDAGEKLDAEIRKDPPQDAPIRACPSCGFKPFGVRCMACSWEFIPPPKAEMLPGMMREITLGKGKTIDKADLFAQCVAYARLHSLPDKQEWRSRFLFRDIAGELPPNHWDHTTVSRGQELSKEVRNKILAANIRKAKSRGRAYA